MLQRKTDHKSWNNASLSETMHVEPHANARSNAALRTAIATSTPASNLPTLRALISNHRLLLANIKRSNQLLDSDNMRMERELAIRRDPVPSSAAGDGGDAAVGADNAQAKLEWIGNYIHGTLAQTLWALNARAAQLEEQTTFADRQQQAKRLLQMTHAAYDQLRDLMMWLQGNAHD
jgi:hypothetical protein